MDQYLKKPYSKNAQHFQRFLHFLLAYDLSFWFIVIGFPSNEAYIIWGILNVLINVYILSSFSLNFKDYSLYCQVALVLTLIYTLYIFLNFKGEPYNLYAFLRLMYQPTGFLCYLLPFIIHKYVTPECFHILIRWVYIFLLGTLLIVHFSSANYDFEDAYERLHLYIGGGIIFVLFCLDQFEKKEKGIILLAACLSFAISAILARRNVVLTYLLIIPSLIVINGRLTKKSKFLYIMKVLILLSVAAIVLINYYSVLFPSLAERALDDTRTGVELEIMNDITSKDAIWTGLGLNSFYYSDYLSESRDFVETGYINLIYKGGIIYAILFIAFIIPVLFNGLFSKKKRFAQISAFYVLLFIASFSASNTTMSFSIRYVGFWFLILAFHRRDYKNVNYIS